MEERVCVLRVSNGFPYLVIEGRSIRLDEVERAYAKRRAELLAGDVATGGSDRWERGVKLAPAYDGGPLVEKPYFNDSDRG